MRIDIYNHRLKRQTRDEPISKQQARYVPHAPLGKQHQPCYACNMYRTTNSSCRMLQAPVLATGTCDFFERRDDTRVPTGDQEKVPQSLLDLKASNSDKIASIDVERGDATGARSIWLYLKNGWCNGDQGSHIIHEDRVGDVKRAFQRVAPCQCSDCRRGRGGYG